MLKCYKEGIESQPPDCHRGDVHDQILRIAFPSDFRGGNLEQNSTELRRCNQIKDYTRCSGRPAGRPISLGLEEKEDATPRRFGFTTRCDTIGSWKDARKEGRFRFAGWSSPTPTPTDCCQYESPFNMAWNFKQKASRGEGRRSVG